MRKKRILAVVYTQIVLLSSLRVDLSPPSKHLASGKGVSLAVEVVKNDTCYYSTIGENVKPVEGFQPYLLMFTPNDMCCNSEGLRGGSHSSS